MAPCAGFNVSLCRSAVSAGLLIYWRSLTALHKKKKACDLECSPDHQSFTKGEDAGMARYGLLEVIQDLCWLWSSVWTPISWIAHVDHLPAGLQVWLLPLHPCAYDTGCGWKSRSPGSHHSKCKSCRSGSRLSASPLCTLPDASQQLPVLCYSEATWSTLQRAPGLPAPRSLQSSASKSSRIATEPALSPAASGSCHYQCQAPLRKQMTLSGSSSAW